MTCKHNWHYVGKSKILLTGGRMSQMIDNENVFQFICERCGLIKKVAGKNE